MATSQQTAGKLSVLAAGVTGFLEGKEGRQDAKIKQAKGQAQLEQLQYQKETGTMQQQVDTLNAKNNELMVQNSKQATYRALDAYAADGDPRHMNELSKTDPMLKTRLKDLASLDKLDPVNDAELIRNSDKVPEGAFEANFANASRRFLKITKADGSKEILDMHNVYAGTGYTRQLEKGKLETLLKQSKVSKALGGTQKDTAMERNAVVIADAKDRIAEARAKGEEPATRDLERVALGETKKAGVTAGKLSSAEDATEELVKDFGGRDKFFKTSFDPSTEEGQNNFLDAYSNVARIEKFEGVVFNSKQKTELNKIRILIAMGDPAKDLTEEETGLIDNTFHNVRKYVSDNVSGVAAASAWAAFRNITRHVIAGSALTAAEISAYREAFGTLGQKLGPVLQQFKLSLTQVKAKLQSIARIGNPYVSKVRLGIDEERMDRMLVAIDDRIEALENFEAEEAPAVSKPKLKGNFGGTR